MRAPSKADLLPGMSVLGGAAAGFSYEGVLRDAMARSRPQRADEARAMPRQQTQASRPEAPAAQAKLQREG